VDLLVCGSLDSFLADIESEVYDSSCLNDWASKPWSEYIPFANLREVVLQPFNVTETLGNYDVLVNVIGGGYSGQAGATRHGIARALLTVDPDFRAALKAAGLLTRDSRMKERKKPGLKKARKASQFSKR